MEHDKKMIIFEYSITFVLLLLIVSCVLFIINHIRDGERKLMENTTLVLYEGPKSLKDASETDLQAVTENQRDISLMHCTDTTISVNGQDCYVYDTNVNNNRQWMTNYLPPLTRTPVAYFDFEGVVKIEVTVPKISIKQVTISPLSEGIKPKIDTKNHKITFTVTKPDAYTIQFNDSPERAVHIFANALEQDAPSADDEDVIYIGPGEWDIESITLEDNQTLYISGGAVVHGVVNGTFAKNVTVKGRGMIDGSHFAGWQGKQAYVPLKFDHCENVSIKDVLVLNANAWVCQAFDSKQGTIDGLKIISPRPNGDGITLQSCTDFEVINCFVRSWDDSLVVKNYAGSSSNITFKDIQIWTDLAQSMEIGFETNKGNQSDALIENIIFEDITVINNFHKPVISIHNADDATISNILFKDIDIENAQMGSGDGEKMPYLIDLLITQNAAWSTTKERGQIRDVVIENVYVHSGKACASRIQGYDGAHTVEGVKVINLNVLGERILSFEQCKFEIDEATTHNLIIE